MDGKDRGGWLWSLRRQWLPFIAPLRSHDAAHLWRPPGTHTRGFPPTSAPPDPIAHQDATEGTKLSQRVQDFVRGVATGTRQDGRRASPKTGRSRDWLSSKSSPSRRLNLQQNLQTGVRWSFGQAEEGLLPKLAANHG